MRRTLHRLVIVAATLSLVGCATEATLGPLHAAQHDCQMGNLAACMALPQLQANVDAETQANGNVVAAGLLASETPKGPVSLRFPAETLETLFTRLFPET